MTLLSLHKDPSEKKSALKGKNMLTGTNSFLAKQTPTGKVDNV